MDAEAVGAAHHPSLDERWDPAVRIVDHDPAWAGSARAELRRIAAAIRPTAVRLEHVGSTAVPGLAAKPVLDLQVSVVDVGDRAAYVPVLEGLGYLFAPTPESPDFHFFGRPPQRPRTHHVHVCCPGSEHERRQLAVRDFLRAHLDEAAAYEAVKRDVASCGAIGRETICLEHRSGALCRWERVELDLSPLSMTWMYK